MPVLGLFPQTDSLRALCFSYHFSGSQVSWIFSGFSLQEAFGEWFPFSRWTLTSILCTLSGSVCMRITWGEGPTPLEFSSQYIWGRTQVCAFLRNSHIMLALVNQGPHLKTTIVKTKNWLSYAGLTPISFFHWAIKSKNTLKFKETLSFSLHLKKLKPLR